MKKVAPRELRNCCGQNVMLVGRYAAGREKGDWSFVLVRDFQTGVLVQGVCRDKLADLNLRSGAVVALFGKVEAEQRSPEGVVLMVEGVHLLAKSLAGLVWAAIASFARSVWL